MRNTRWIKKANPPAMLAWPMFVLSKKESKYKAKGIRYSKPKP